MTTNGLLEEPALVRLLPKQVGDSWNVLGNYISVSLPPTVQRSEPAMINVLKAIMKEELVCWIFVKDKSIRALITTTVWVDKVSGSKDLLIYSFTTLDKDLGVKDWNVMISSLKDFANTKNCGGIIAYTSNVKVADFLRSRGAKADNILIQMEV